MINENEQTEFIPVELPDGTLIKVEVTQTGLEEVVSIPFSFERVTMALEGIVDAITKTFEKVNPDKATVKFGMEMIVESGTLTTILVKGSGKGNLEISLEWESKKKKRIE